MNLLRISDILTDKVLVSRESARLLERPLGQMMTTAMPLEREDDPTRIAVDFQGVEGIAPSFLDELLTLFESLLGEENSGIERSLIVKNPPMRLSLKFQAIARGHGMSVQALPDGSWLLADASSSTPHNGD